MRITLEQFCEQWAPKGNGRYLPNKMEFNTHDFVTMAGEYSKSRFRTSFAEGGLYGSGKLWPERKSRWGRRFTHPVMNDTGNLSRSISGRRSAWTAPTLPSVRMANGKDFPPWGSLCHLDQGKQLSPAWEARRFPKLRSRAQHRPGFGALYRQSVQPSATRAPAVYRH